MAKKVIQRGGYRQGSGRPKGSGKFREKTHPIRIPESLLSHITEMLDCYAEGSRNALPPEYGDTLYQPLIGNTQALPLYGYRVAAGFPSPADDHIETKLDLNDHLIKRPAATFFVRVQGDSMIGTGIHENDILVVDRSITPLHGKIVIAVLNGELTVKRLHSLNGQVSLIAENEKYPPLPVTEGMEFSIWGVVTSVIHAV